MVTEDPSIEGRQGDVNTRGAQVRDEDMTCVRPEGQLARRPSARARPDVALRDQPTVDKLADPPDDDRPAETRPVDELRAGSGSAEADLVEDKDQRVERLVRQRPDATGSERWIVGHAAIIRRAAPRLRDFCT